MSALSLPEFADRINEIMPVMLKEFVRQQESEFYKVKITLPQFIILDFIGRQGEPNMSDIARAMNVTTAAMTGIVDRLVREAYVVRLHDTEDRRIVMVRLTQKGSRILKDMLQKKRRMIIKIFGRVSQKERQAYLDILMHIKDILNRPDHIL